MERTAQQRTGATAAQQRDGQSIQNVELEMTEVGKGLSAEDGADIGQDENRTAAPARFTGSMYLKESSSETSPSTPPPGPRWAPLPDTSRRQFARDSSATSKDDHDGDLGASMRPNSSDSLPLQRVTSHGRESILELDLADTHIVGEPMSAAELAVPNLHERERRRRGRRYGHRRRHRTPSIASGRTRRTVRSRAGEAIKALKERTRRNSSSSNSSTTSSSSTSSGSSSSSSSTGIHWKFWRASSASTLSDDSYIPPEPTFTLHTPRLANPIIPLDNEPAFASLDKTKSVPHPYTSRSAEQRESAAPAMLAAPEVWDTLGSAVLLPCLDKLCKFWQERDQQDSLGGDIGAAHRAPKAEPNLPSRTEASTPGDEEAAHAPRSTPTPLPAREYAKGPPRNMRQAGPAWWLDVQCPSAADMRELRRLIPLHPLTMEDILAQETREKIEVHDKLGYYFMAFRALDETYFRYTDPSEASGSTDNLSKDVDTSTPGEGSSSSKDSSDGDKKSEMQYMATLKEKKSFERERSLRRSKSMDKADRDDLKLQKGRVQIVEGPKDGVEGVGVGAVNVYLVVFGDGIISFHFEDIIKHTNKVRDRIQQFGIARNISSHWIAYGLMDSIVDTFFPLINFIEAESNDIDHFLSNPLHDPRRARPSADRGRRYPDLHTLYRNITLPGFILSLMERLRQHKSASPIQVNAPPGPMGTPSPHHDLLHMQHKLARPAMAPKTLARSALLGVDDKLYDRAQMLKRIADLRKLVTGLSRLLTPKNDVVRGLRKRVREEGLATGNVQPGQRHDINIYLGDLQDHIVTMHQTLHFFDTMLSHDHPAYLGVLRLAFEAAKIGNDKAIVRLYIVTLTFLPINIFCGVFGTNVKVPHNGTADDHSVNSDGTPAAYWWFGIVIVGVLIISGLMAFVVYWTFRQTRKAYKKRGAMTRL